MTSLPKYPFDIDVSNITAMKIDVEGFEAAVFGVPSTRCGPISH